MTDKPVWTSFDRPDGLDRATFEMKVREVPGTRRVGTKFVVPQDAWRARYGQPAEDEMEHR